MNPPARLQVGINYRTPYFGWQFGIPPVGDTGKPAPRNQLPASYLSTDLAEIRRHGFRAIRISILGDGFNYGSWNVPKGAMAQASHFVPADKMQVAAIVKDAKAFFQVVKASGLLVLPVLVDHTLFAWEVKQGTYSTAPMPVPKAPGSYKSGRSALLTDAAKRKAFLEGTAVPLFEACRAFAGDPILAWDVMDEPEVALERAGGAYTLRDLAAFTGSLVAAAGASGFSTSIGHKTPMARPTFEQELTAWASQQQKEGERTKQNGIPTFPQVHFYPHNGSASELSRHTGAPGIVGEFASRGPEEVGGQVPPTKWPDGRLRLCDRLQHIQDRGYSWAFPWVYPATGAAAGQAAGTAYWFSAEDRAITDLGQLHQVLAFNAGICPPFQPAPAVVSPPSPQGAGSPASPVSPKGPASRPASSRPPFVPPPFRR